MTFDTEQAVAAFNKWCFTTGRALSDMETFSREYGTLLLVRLEIPVDRILIGTLPLHAQVGAFRWKWEAVAPETCSWGALTREEYGRRADFFTADAPFLRLERGEAMVRLRPGDPLPASDFEWYLEGNYTDYIALPLMVGTKYQGAFAWSTTHDDGFSDAHVQFFQTTVDWLSTVVSLYVKDLVMKFLLHAYLGKDAGERVDAGHIVRGQGISIRSVVWFSDIRDFTKLSDEVSTKDVLEVINGVCELTDHVVKKYGGQILKYIGDGTLVIFAPPAHETSTEHGQEDWNVLCENARKAAAEFLQKLDEWSAGRQVEGKRGAKVGIGLHFGECVYGNMGSPERLDFTVIGPSVNLASRVESLCKTLQAKVLATEAFVELECRAGSETTDQWTERGQHKVKGVAEPVTIFELKQRE